MYTSNVWMEYLKQHANINNTWRITNFVKHNHSLDFTYSSSTPGKNPTFRGSQQALGLSFGSIMQQSVKVCGSPGWGHWYIRESVSLDPADNGESRKRLVIWQILQ